MPSIRLPLLSDRVRYGLVVVVAAVILLASVGEPTPGTVPYGPFGLVKADKWSHGIGYAGLTAALVYALVPGGTGRRRRLVMSVCLAVAFGVCVELIQWPLPYRASSTIDTVANAIGACCMAAVWSGLARTPVVDFEDAS